MSVQRGRCIVEIAETLLVGEILDEGAVVPAAGAAQCRDPCDCPA